MNVGVVFFCRPRRYLAARIALDEARLAAFAPELDVAEVRAHLDAMTRIAAGERGFRAGRAARAVRALPLARRAVEHGDPDLAGPHRAVRGPGGDAGAACWRSSSDEGDRARACTTGPRRTRGTSPTRSRAAPPTGPSRSAARSTRRPTPRCSSTRWCPTSCGRRSTSSSPRGPSSSSPRSAATAARAAPCSRATTAEVARRADARGRRRAGVPALPGDDVLAAGPGRARARRPPDRRRRGRRADVPAVVARLPGTGSRSCATSSQPLLELPVEHVLCSHWDPVIGGGHAALHALR